MRYLIGVVLSCVLLQSCMLETFQRPAIPVKNRWTVTDSFSTLQKTEHLPYLAWWHDFDDPTLNRLMQKALIHNTDVDMARARIEAAVGELNKIRYQWIPNMEFWVGYSGNPSNGNPGSLFVFIPRYILNVYQQIHQQKIAQLQLMQSKADLAAVKLTVIAEVAASYFIYQAAVEYKDLLQTLREDTEHMARIVQKMKEDGLVSNIEPDVFWSQVDLIAGDQETNERNIIMAGDAIRYVLDENPGDIITQRHFADLQREQMIPGSMPLNVLCDRPDMKVAEYQLRVAYYKVGLAKSPFLPRFDLNYFPGQKAGNGSYSMPRLPIGFSDQLVKASIFEWTVLGDIEKANAEKKAAYFHFVDVLRKVLRDTTDAYTTHDRSTKKLHTTQRAVKHLHDAYALNARLTQDGVQSELETLKSKVVFDRIRLKLNQDQLKRLLSVVRLYQELAGGYRFFDHQCKECSLPRVVTQ